MVSNWRQLAGKRGECQTPCLGGSGYKSLLRYALWIRESLSAEAGTLPIVAASDVGEKIGRTGINRMNDRNFEWRLVVMPFEKPMPRPHRICCRIADGHLVPTAEMKAGGERVRG